MMKEQDFIAHVRVEEDAFRIQTVKEHSVGTATLSESFASVFGAAAWGKQNGWWHDMGKYTKNSFQPYIRNASGMAVEQKVVDKPDHSSAGAILAREKLPGYYPPLAYKSGKTKSDTYQKRKAIFGAKTKSDENNKGDTRNSIAFIITLMMGYTFKSNFTFSSPANNCCVFPILFS